jgi:2-C-methyl-D-erythritol 4-phosphate cytidylyltransferase/2-C-methyl-D-erythritol 2,4-cyclodiphosphate synthase
MPRVAAIVVAGGRSARFGGAVPKQFLGLGGEAVLDRSLRAVARRPGVDGAVVVLPASEERGGVADRLRSDPSVVAVVAGGPTRARSVREGIRAASGFEYVLVHDAARPLVPPRVVDDVIEATLRHGAAIPVLEVLETVKEADGEGFVAGTVDRARLRLAQTPQGARTDWLEASLEAAFARGEEPTDEAQALERAGRRVALVAGDPTNLKITTPGDLERAAWEESGRARPTLRVGTGFDIHRFGEGRRLVLGGVEFPGERGLEGHSDADVVLHAAMDALLGAAALGDIGALFPPGDPAFLGADSRRLAAEVARRVREAGWEVTNLDLTLLGERPKIRPRVDAMRAAVAEAFGLAPGQVGLKATTLEGIGGLGRAEGLACQAVALLVGAPR